MIELASIWGNLFDITCRISSQSVVVIHFELILIAVSSSQTKPFFAVNEVSGHNMLSLILIFGLLFFISKLFVIFRFRNEMKLLFCLIFSFKKIKNKRNRLDPPLSIYLLKKNILLPRSIMAGK